MTGEALFLDMVIVAFSVFGVVLFCTSLYANGERRAK